MKKNLTFITIFALVLLASLSTRAQQNWYVDSTATGANDGSSWANAFRFLSDATNAARSSTTTDTIFVAKGTYFPTGTQSTGSVANRDTAFIFTRNNLAVLGGYPNGGGVRNSKINITILSGKINTNTSTVLNSYHVIVAAGTSGNPLDNTLLFDGFKITESVGATSATDSVIINNQLIYKSKGGGIYNRYASPTLTNNIFTQLASSNGGGIYNIYSSPRIINNVINANTASVDGLGIFNDSLSSPVISNVVISGNGGAFGGAITNKSAAAPILINVTITGNRGYGFKNIGNNSSALKNCIISNNALTLSNTVASPATTFANCLIDGYSVWNTSYGINLGNNILNANPAFVTPFPSSPNSTNTPSTVGNFQLKLTSPAIGKGDTAGVSQYLPATDFLGNSRIFGTRIDMGAYEFFLPSNTIYVDSSATAGNKTGDSWANALTSLSYATNVVAKEFPMLDTILIAKGTYTPTDSTTSTLRDTAFILTRGNLALLGGYPSGGNGTRDWNKNPVVLSGRAGSASSYLDNLFHVIIAIGSSATPIDSSLRFDGMTFTDGYCDYYSSSGYSIYDTINGQLIRRQMGAGIYNHYASPTIMNCNVINNYGEYGCGIYLSRSTSTLANTSIRGNTASSLGAGMYSDSSAYTMVNCVISGNVAYSDAGGILNRYASPTIINTTITGNYSSVSYGDGAAMENYLCDPVIKNCIVYGNTTGINNSSANPVISNSIIQNSGGSTAWLPATGVDSGSNLDTDPIFMVPIIANTTPKTNGNFQIQFGSPAIDAGDTAGINQYLPSVDMWNNSRLTGNQIDMGAYEFGEPQHLIYVDSSAVSGANNGTDWANALISLSQATNIAGKYSNVDSILVAKGTYYPTKIQAGTNRDASFVFSRGNLAVLGGYPSGGSIVRNSTLNVTTLSGNIGNSTLSSDNSHHIVVAAGTGSTPIDSTLKIDGFTITGGNANVDTGSVLFNTQAIARNIGGGMVNYYAAPAISNIIITKDTASANGGGMYNFYSSPVITNTSFSLNTAKNGGAIFDTVSSPVITAVIFRGNRASNNGAGMYNISTSSPKITGSLFSGNNAASNGGAILNSTSSAPTIVNTTIASNFAVNLGGGIINLAASAPVIRNSIVYANNSGVTNVASNPTVSYSIMQDGGYAGSNNNINQNPLFQTPLLAANVPSIAGNFQLLGGSPAINAGDTTGISQYLPLYDLIGFHRIMGASIDRGAYEYVRALYVDSAIANPGRGTSWTDAYKYLSDATNSARNVYAIDSIFVAKGTYYPTGQQNINNRDTAFIFTRSGTTVLGGYPNGGGVRDWVANPVILNGNIGAANDSADNVYHVILAIGSSTSPLDSTLKIDGFTIRNGNANGPSTSNATINGQLIPRREGGGVRNHYASPVMTNLFVTANYGEGGGGVFNYVSSPVMTNSTYSQNVSGSGGGISNITSSPVITNVTVINNIGSFGGGIYNAVSSGPQISNCFIKGNTASSQGGGICNSQNIATLTISNTVITGNTGGLGGGISNLSGSNPGLTINNCVVSDNIATGAGGGGIYNSTSAYPVIINTRIIGNKATANGAFGGGIYSTSSTPAVRNCVIAGNKAYNGGGGIYNTSTSPAVITNTTISGNLATNGSVNTSGGGIYNVTSSPVVRNSIIYGNSTGIFNSSASSSPNFKNSIVQGSGGSAAWVSATGVNGGNNKDVYPSFIDPVSYTMAPDTSGNYSITICSKAVNMGDTTGIGQTIPALDLAGNARYMGTIDAGAYEIDTLNPATMSLPTVGGVYTSDRSFQQGNLTHFCNCDSNRLLVTLDTFGTNVIITDTSIKVRTGTAVAAYYQQGTGFVTNPNGTAIFNREWAVLPIAEPTSPVTVYTYYTDSDYVSVNNVMNSLMLPPLASDTQMYFYKVTDTGLGLFPSIYNIGINQVQIITYGASPSVNNWVAGALGTNKYAEYKVNSFSGGGGGGTSESNTPLPLQILSLTGKNYGNYNLLSWDISNDVTKWDLERSTNSTDFKVMAKGLSDVRSFKDEHPQNGVNYYRLKAITSGGQITYSAIIALNSNSKGGGVLVYPVPATQSITVHCSNMTFIGQKGKIIDNAGKYVGSFVLQQESNIDISHLAAGIYQIQLPDGSAMKIVKE